MGKIIQLYPSQKRQNKSRKWSLSTFEELAKQAQRTIDSACQMLEHDFKALQRQTLITYEQGITILQTVRNLYQQIDAWSIVIYDDEHLPFLAYTHRLPLLSACFQVKQHSGDAINFLAKSCARDKSELISTAEIRSQLKIVLKSWKVFSHEMKELLDLIRLRKQYTSVG
jgi:hypothetical protein